MNNNEEFLNEDFEIEFFEENIDDLKELDEFLSFAYNEGYLDDLLLQENIRQLIKNTQGKLNRVDRVVSRQVDSIGDAVIDGSKKYDIPTVRREILRGRKSVSQLIKTYMKIIAMGSVAPPLGLVGFITHLFRSKFIRGKQRLALLQDLKTELEIVEEKIKDAEADNDRKKKYQYIRLRREIQRGIEQIRFGQRANLERNSMIRL